MHIKDTVGDISLMCICFCWFPQPYYSSYTWQFVFHHLCFTSLPSPSSEPFLASLAPQTEAKARKKLSQLLLRHNPTDAMLGDWFSFPPSFSFLLFFWPCTLSVLSISLSSTDLWDQPSKTDSEFFTDRECVSSYVTEAKIKREKRGEQVNM